MLIRIISVIVAAVLSCYILFVSVYFSEVRQEKECEGVRIVVRDSLDKHFVTEQDLLAILRRASINPVGKSMNGINTDKIENELLKNEMIRKVEVYKTPSGVIKLEVEQKMPILRIMGMGGNYYVDNEGGTMPVSSHYVAHVPIVTGYVEKGSAKTDLYKFALFLQEDKFWNNQVDQIVVLSNKEIELIPRVGNHRILLGTLDDFQEKLENLRLFYRQAIPYAGWEKYSLINLKFKNQVVCVKR